MRKVERGDHSPFADSGQTATEAGDVQLPIVPQREITSHPSISLPLCVVLAQDRFIPWYHMRFVQLLVRKHHRESDHVQVRYAVPSYPAIPEVFDYHLMSYLDEINMPLFMKEGPVSLFRRFLRQGWYLFVALDEFHMEEKWHYRVSHHVHPSLVYGYSDREHSFHCIGYSRRQVQETFRMGYSEADNAVRSARNIKAKPQYGIIALRPRTNAAPYRLEELIEALDAYAAGGEMSPEELCPTSFDIAFGTRERVLAGTAVYDALVENIEMKASKGSKLEYHSFHVLAEHKHGMERRLRYAAARTGCTGLVEVADEWRMVARPFEEARRGYLIALMREQGKGSIYRQLSDKRALRRLGELIRAGERREGPTLKETRAVLGSLPRRRVEK